MAAGMNVDIGGGERNHVFHFVRGDKQFTVEAEVDYGTLSARCPVCGVTCKLHVSDYEGEVCEHFGHLSGDLFYCVDDDAELLFVDVPLEAFVEFIGEYLLNIAGSEDEGSLEQIIRYFASQPIGPGCNGEQFGYFLGLGADTPLLVYRTVLGCVFVWHDDRLWALHARDSVSFRKVLERWFGRPELRAPSKFIVRGSGSADMIKRPVYVTDEDGNVVGVEYSDNSEVIGDLLEWIDAARSSGVWSAPWI